MGDKKWRVSLMMLMMLMMPMISDDADDADCDDLATMSQGGIEPQQNCFQKTGGEGEGR